MIKAAHLRVSEKEATPHLINYMKKLASLGVNFLVLELGYSFERFPELSSGTFDKEDAKKVRAAAKEHGITLAPLFMCLGHQGWGIPKNKLLELHPEFCETPEATKGEELPDGKKMPDLVAGKPINNTPNGDFYCHSWCASEDGIYEYVFPMMDEIADALGAQHIHVGMDETFSIAEDCCPRCVGRDRAVLYARVVNKLYSHIVKERGKKMLMWGDRLNNTAVCNYGDWEGDALGIWRAIDMIPNDIIICDWHYEMTEGGFPGVSIFIEKGFTVLPSCWRSGPQAKWLWEDSKKRADSAKGTGELWGMMVTCWAEANAEYLQKLIEAVDKADAKTEENDHRGVVASLLYLSSL